VAVADVLVQVLDLLDQEELVFLGQLVQVQVFNVEVQVLNSCFSLGFGIGFHFDDVHRTALLSLS